MTYIVTEPCIGTKDRACVEVCPVECFYEGTDQLYIHPEECIDCAACEPVCPVTAIFPEENVPDQWKSYIKKNYKFIEEYPEAPHALTKPMLGGQDNFGHTFTAEGKTITLPPPPSGFGGPAPPPPKAEAKAAPAAPPKAEAPPAPPKGEAPKPEAAAPKAAAPPRPVTVASDDVITQIAESAAAAAEAAARAAEAAAAAIRLLQGKADGRTGFGAPSAPAAKPHAPTRPEPVEAKAPAAPTVEPKKEPVPSAPAARLDPSFDRGKAVLFSLIDFESGSREVSVEELSRAEETATKIFEEIAKAVGKRDYDLIKDLEKKDVVLRQKLELANAILDRVARARLQAEITRQWARTREQVPGAVIALSIAGACSILGLFYALKYSFVTPETLSLQDLVTAPFTPEGFMPFIGFNLLAGLFALFGLGALYKLARSWVEACHLEALLPREFGAASLRPRRWSWVYRMKIESARILDAQKMLRALAAKKR
jgi:NAD-dependent dihydropyrimidine dehydrogenase PreA subunit